MLGEHATPIAGKTTGCTGQRDAVNAPVRHDTSPNRTGTATRRDEAQDSCGMAMMGRRLQPDVAGRDPGARRWPNGCRESDMSLQVA